MSRSRARFPIVSPLVAVLCAAVLLTSLGGGGWQHAARGEIVGAAPVDQPLGDPVVELLQLRDLAGFIGGRVGFTLLAVHAVECGNPALVRWRWDAAATSRAAARSGQNLHSLYCVWIV